MSNQPVIFVVGDTVVANLNFEEQSKLLDELEATSGYTELIEGVFLISDKSVLHQLQTKHEVASL